MSNENQFIKINNKLIIEETKDQLTSKELYLYSLLLFEKHMKSNLKTNLILLSSLVGVKFGSSRIDKINNNIRSVLSSLENRSLIRLSSLEYEPLNTYKSNELIVINFNDSHETDSEFTIVYENKFNQFKDIFHYHIYVATKRWDGKDYFECSYGRWEKVLNKSRQFTFDKVSEAVEEEIIFMTVGDYYKNESLNKKIQQANKYNTVPFQFEHKSNTDKKASSIEENEKYHNNIQYGDMHEINLIFGINVFKTEETDGINIYPQKKDYIFYMKVRDKALTKKISDTEREFLKIAERRINNLSQKDNVIFQKEWNLAEEEYEKDRVFISEDLSDYF